MLALAALLGLVMGAVIGGLGGGGGVLTVPALVYLLGQSAQDATTASVVVVGITAAAASLPACAPEASTGGSVLKCSVSSGSRPRGWAPS